MPTTASHDSETHGTELLNTKQILAHSSNIGAIEIGEKLGDQGLYDWIRRFGFGTPTGVDLPGEEPGLVPAVASWSGSTIGNLPIGQGVSVTPLQIAAAYAAIANGGVLRPPHLVARVGGASVPIPTGHRILTPTVAAQLRGMLEGVLGPSGTASEISIPGYSLAGKTGTANKVVNGTYSHKDYVASFVGFAPAAEPPARGDRRRRPAAGVRDLRHRGRRTGLAEDHGLRAPLPEDRPRLSRPPGPASVRPPGRASYTAPA